ncbi:MAG: hypothetical protein CMF41_05955 [Legionellales bacterium]|nr:hypothetical protein [Legionellales bacterium]OUX64256.1 MAG: hypothetical protein CBE41_03570 [Gammaproteobacteria bacterium TMED281]|tara:strand:- start:459 stop:890 length:432 start_codon:yes stop_codon:yes gene_type:complete
MSKIRLFILSYLSMGVSFAELVLYDGPSQNAKNLGTITPKKITVLTGEYIKVKDNESGKVGWVEKIALEKFVKAQFNLENYLDTENISYQGYDFSVKSDHATHQESRIESNQTMVHADKFKNQFKKLSESMELIEKSLDELFD